MSGRRPSGRGRARPHGGSRWPARGRSAYGPAADRVRLGAVAQGAGGLLPSGLDPAVELLGPGPLPQLPQLVGGAADLGDHRVGGEEGADRVGVREAGRAAGDVSQDPHGRVGEALGPAGPVVLKGLLAGGERLADLGAPVGQFGEKGVGVREPALQVLQPQQQAGELVVARLRGVGRRERSGDGLAQEGGLGGELRLPLMDEEFAAARVEGGAGPVGAAEHLGDPLQDARTDRGVADLQSGDDLGDGAQARRRLVKAGEQGRRLGDGGDVRRRRADPGDVLVVAGHAPHQPVVTRRRSRPGSAPALPVLRARFLPTRRPPARTTRGTRPHHLQPPHPTCRLRSRRHH